MLVELRLVQDTGAGTVNDVVKGPTSFPPKPCKLYCPGLRNSELGRMLLLIRPPIWPTLAPEKPKLRVLVPAGPVSWKGGPRSSGMVVGTISGRGLESSRSPGSSYAVQVPVGGKASAGLNGYGPGFGSKAKET